jgi:hypothetical protein
MSYRPPRGTPAGMAAAVMAVVIPAQRYGSAYMLTMLISSASSPACARIQAITSAWSVR